MDIWFVIYLFHYIFCLCRRSFIHLLTRCCRTWRRFRTCGSTFRLRSADTTNNMIKRCHWMRNAMLKRACRYSHRRKRRFCLSRGSWSPLAPLSRRVLYPINQLTRLFDCSWILRFFYWIISSVSWFFSHKFEFLIPNGRRSFQAVRVPTWLLARELALCVNLCVWPWQ